MKLVIAMLVMFATAAWADERPLLWKARCSMCHGRVGRGDTKWGRQYMTPDFTSAEWQTQITDEKIRSTILNGKPATKMRSMRDEATDAQVEELVAFIRSLAPGTAFVVR
jgi:cytochrome c553